MNYLRTIFFVAVTLIIYSFKSDQKDYISDTLKVEALSKNVWIHTSYLKTQDYGNVGCNGMIYKNKNEAIIFDAPTTDSVSFELIKWVETELKCEIVGIVATHFHDDCLGGLAAFHTKNIPSYANELTIKLAKDNDVKIPQKALAKKDKINVGSSSVVTAFLGEGHSKDNIVAYVPTENVLFGGCLVKKLNASKGYLGDANVNDWSNTVEKVKKEFPKIKWVIPGHGKSGGIELLDYTIELFENQ